MIDAFAYHTFYKEDWIPRSKAESAYSSDSDSDSDSGSEVEVDVSKDAQDGCKVRREVREPFTEEHHLLSVATVKAFDIENREWAEFYIDGFSDIAWNEAAYDKLVLDESEKNMILAFSEQMKDAEERSDDIIKNKGRAKSDLSDSFYTKIIRSWCSHVTLRSSRSWKDAHRRICR